MTQYLNVRFCRKNKSWTDPELLNYVYSYRHMSYFNRHFLIIKLLKMFQPILKFQVVKLLSWKETIFNVIIIIIIIINMIIINKYK